MKSKTHNFTMVPLVSKKVRPRRRRVHLAVSRCKLKF